MRKECRNIAAQRKRVDAYDSAIEVGEALRQTQIWHRRLLNQSKFRASGSDWGWSVSASPQGMNGLWLWMHNANPLACRAWHKATGKAIQQWIKKSDAEIKRLCK